MISSLIIASTLVSGLAFANAEPGPGNGELVNVDARYVFAPEGFDDNDEAVVMVDGYLPSGCYKLTRPEYTVDEQTKTITIKPMARYFDVACIEALIPYQFEVKLGILSEGLYTVKLNNAAVDSIDVAEASSAGPDDYLYAPIDGASVSTTDTGVLQATLEGRFTNSCMVWDDLKVIDTGKTINVLPVMRIEGDSCIAGEFPFKKIVNLPESVVAGRHLLHVRSLNGNAINHLFYKSPY
jgi:hypothetical protein